MSPFRNEEEIKGQKCPYCTEQPDAYWPLGTRASAVQQIQLNQQCWTSRVLSSIAWCAFAMQPNQWWSTSIRILWVKKSQQRANELFSDLQLSRLWKFLFGLNLSFNFILTLLGSILTPSEIYVLWDGVSVCPKLLYNEIPWTVWRKQQLFLTILKGEKFKIKCRLVVTLLVAVCSRLC